jgi:hypothetical protein
MAKKKNTKPGKSVARKPTARGSAASRDFQSAFAGLKKILQGHAGKLFVKKDEPGEYYLETQSASWKCQRMFFGAVVVKKSYVSFHLMPLYTSPELAKTISGELDSRKQGKACFNFTKPDAKLFAELAKLTRAGLQKYKVAKFL